MSETNKMDMTAHERFRDECAREIAAQGGNTDLADLTRRWMDGANAGKYSYHFEWMGRPIIQYPQDVVAVQELIWAVRPDLVIETGIAHGGSLILSASVLALLDMCDAIQAGTTIDPRISRRRVLGVDIDIRAHNRAAIAAHPMASRIQMIQGSSVDADVVSQVKAQASAHRRVLVFLDSNHTHDHVLAELEAYAPLTSPGSYCVVFDTVIEHMPDTLFADRPWSKGNNPMTAVAAFLQKNDDFEIDREIDSKLLITVAPGGYLRRTRA